jgi:predicted nucleic acid-binding Zn ribbon protein
MSIPKCKVCGSYMLPGATTCSEGCRLEWKAARQRAQRARRRALEQLGLALGSLSSVQPPWRAQLHRYYRKLLAASPSELAQVDDRRKDWPAAL